MPESVVSRESPIPFTAARKEFPLNPALGTLHRWRQVGIRGVRLEAWFSGRRLWTTKEACARFLAAINEDAPDANGASSVLKRRAELRQADQQLEAAGIL